VDLSSSDQQDVGGGKAVAITDLQDQGRRLAADAILIIPKENTIQDELCGAALGKAMGQDHILPGILQRLGRDLYMVDAGLEVGNGVAELYRTVEAERICT